MNVIDLVAGNACFQGIERQRIEDLMRESHIRCFQRSEALWRQGARTRYLAFVIDGRVKRVLRRTGGRELILDILGPGRIVNTLPSDGDELTASIIGMSDGAVVLLDRHLFFERLKDCGPVAVNLLRQFSREQQDLVARLQELSAGAIESRLATLFLRLIDEEGELTPEGISLRIPLSRQDLAALTDTTIETAIRVMSRWNRDGTLLTRREGFLIPDVRALEQRFD